MLTAEYRLTTDTRVVGVMGPILRSHTITQRYLFYIAHGTLDSEGITLLQKPFATRADLEYLPASP